MNMTQIKMQEVISLITIILSMKKNFIIIVCVNRTSKFHAIIPQQKVITLIVINTEIITIKVMTTTMVKKLLNTLKETTIKSITNQDSSLVRPINGILIILIKI